MQPVELALRADGEHHLRAWEIVGEADLDLGTGRGIAVEQGLDRGNAGLYSVSGCLRYHDRKPPGPGLSLGPNPPLTPEYQSIYDENLEDMGKGGQGIDPTATCVSPGMPRVMINYLGFEIVITPKI